MDKNAEGIKLLLIFCALQFAFAAFALVYAFTSGLALLVGVIAGRIARDSLMQPMRGAMDRSSEVRDC